MAERVTASALRSGDSHEATAPEWMGAVLRSVGLTFLSLSCTAKAFVFDVVARRLPRILLDGNA
jgi:hypothetical protein